MTCSPRSKARKQSGTSRIFTSPPLSPGKDYTYEVKARWKKEGSEVQQTRNIVIHAGDHINLAFPTGSEPEVLAIPDAAPLRVEK